MREIAAIFAGLEFIGSSVLAGCGLVQNAILAMLGAIFWMLIFLGEDRKC
jgi:hypothetical protein